jgi:hypothetical protein
MRRDKRKLLSWVWLRSEGADDLLNYLMILLIHNLKFTRPERTELFDAGLGGVQVRGRLQPNRRLVIVFSYDVVVTRLHGIASLSSLVQALQTKIHVRASV